MQTLLWLRWRGLLDEATYWFRLIDYDFKDRSAGNRAFTVYLLVFVAWWTLVVLSILSTFAIGFGQALTIGMLAQFRDLAPFALFLAQIAVLCWGLRTTPLRLSLPDTLYLSNAISLRIPLVLLRFLESITLPVVIGIAVGYFGTLALFRTATESMLYGTALLNAGTCALILFATFAIAWVFGLIRVSLPNLHRVVWLWLTPALMLACLLIQPSPASTIWQPYVDALFSTPDVKMLWSPQILLALAGITGITLLAHAVDMTIVREESAVYAQLQAIGLLRFAIPATYERAEREIKSVRIKPRLRLPETNWLMTLIARSGLSFVRQPKLLLQTFSAAVLISTAVGISFGQIAPFALIAWLYGAMLLPTNGLTYTFRIDTEDRFLRQFLKLNHLPLFAGESALAIGLTSVLSLIGLWPTLTTQGSLLIGVALTVCMAAMMAACHAASLLPLTSFRFQPSHGVLVMLAFGITFVAGMALGSAIAVLGACVLCLFCLMWLIATSPGQAG